MGSIHEQLLSRLSAALSPSQRAAVQLLAQRLRAAAGCSNLARFRVLLGSAGGKDSLQALAFLRTAQLSIARSQPRTFILRVALYRTGSTCPMAFDNLLRACDALFLQDDPRVELLLEPDAAAAGDDRQDVSGARLNLLVSGHLGAGNERLTFANGHYLAMAAAYQRALAWGGEVKALLVTEPAQHLRRYLAWGLRAARQAGVQAQPGNPLATIEALGHAYQRELHGQSPQPRAIHPAATRPDLKWLALDDVMETRSPEHWRLLTQLLGYRHPGLDSVRNELDGISPQLLAHLSGLRSEYLGGKGYARGVHDYLRTAVPQWRLRGMPEIWIQRSLAAWHLPTGMAEQREQANRQAEGAHGVDEVQLVCMLFAPFVGHGAGLRRYLQACHPAMLPALAGLHGALQGQPGAGDRGAWLSAVSGLPQDTLRRLYRSPAAAPGSALMAALRAGDPHARLPQPPPLTGPALRDLIAGRS